MPLDYEKIENYTEQDFESMPLEDLQALVDLQNIPQEDSPTKAFLTSAAFGAAGEIADAGVAVGDLTEMITSVLPYTDGFRLGIITSEENIQLQEQAAAEIMQKFPSNNIARQGGEFLGEAAPHAFALFNLLGGKKGIASKGGKLYDLGKKGVEGTKNFFGTSSGKVASQAVKDSLTPSAMHAVKNAAKNAAGKSSNAATKGGEAAAKKNATGSFKKTPEATTVTPSSNNISQRLFDKSSKELDALAKEKGALSKISARSNRPLKGSQAEKIAELHNRKVAKEKLTSAAKSAKASAKFTDLF